MREGCEGDAGSVAALVAATLSGKGQLFEVWWGGSGLGESATHTHFCRFSLDPKHPIKIVLPIRRGVYHQLRKVGKNYSTDRWTYFGNCPPYTSFGGTLLIDYDAALSKPVIQYDEATVGIGS